MKKIIGIFLLLTTFNLYADTAGCVIEALEKRLDHQLDVDESSVQKKRTFFFNDYAYAGTLYADDGRIIEVSGNVRVNTDNCSIWRPRKTIMGMRILDMYDSKNKLLGVIEGEMIF